MPVEHMQAYLDENYTLGAILKDMANKQNHFFVARLNSALAAENGQVVGFIQMKLGTTEPCIHPHVPMCELHRIYVSADHHGGGMGQLMMERGLKWARDQLLHCKRLDQAVDVERKTGVWLGVWEENVKAQRFYRRYRFEKVGEHSFVIGETTQTDLVMVKWL